MDRAPMITKGIAMALAMATAAWAAYEAVTWALPALFGAPPGP
jgi:hypothetical protein